MGESAKSPGTDFQTNEPASVTTRVGRPMSSALGITFFRLVSEHGSDVASLHTHEGGFVFASNAAARIFGAPLQELRGRTLVSLVHPEDRERVAAALRNTDDAVARVTYRVRHPNGELLWVESVVQNAAGEGVVVCMTRDVSHQRKAALALEEGMLALALRSPDPVFLVQDGMIARANPAAVTQLGAASESAVKGRRYVDVLHPEDAASESEQVARVAASGGATPLHDVRLLGAGGIVTSSQSYALGVSFGGREATMIVIRERPRPDTQAIISDRLRSIGTLAAGLAHELADPVALLLTSLELLSSDDLGDGGSRAKTEALEQARRAGERVYEALKSLRSFSRADEDLRRVLDVREVAAAVLSIVQGRVSSTTRIVRDFTEDPVLVFADQARLSQALLNVVSNAVDAANQRELGEVKLTVRLGSKGSALIEVTDNGPGIDERALDRVFEPFFSTKPIATASGLGLSISHAIVQSLGGRVALESSPGIGTVAMIQLPGTKQRGGSSLGPPSSTIRVAPAPAPPASHAIGMPRVFPKGERARVLLLDDEVQLGAALQRILRNEYEVVVETSAEDALRRLIAGETFDLLLCDLQLPGMSGIDFYGELQRVAPSLVERVVFVTGGVVTPGTQAFLDSRPNLRIDKPFTTSILRQHLRDLLASHGAVAR